MLGHFIETALFNTALPTSALATAGQETDAKSVSSANPKVLQSPAEQKPLYFNAPQISYPQRKPPDPDQPKSPVPTKDPIEFTLVADPELMSPLDKDSGKLHSDCRNEKQIESDCIPMPGERTGPSSGLAYYHLLRYHENLQIRMKAPIQCMGR